MFEFRLQPAWKFLKCSCVKWDFPRFLFLCRLRSPTAVLWMASARLDTTNLAPVLWTSLVPLTEAGKDSSAYPSLINRHKSKTFQPQSHLLRTALSQPCKFKSAPPGGGGAVPHSLSSYCPRSVPLYSRKNVINAFRYHYYTVISSITPLICCHTASAKWLNP